MTQPKCLACGGDMAAYTDKRGKPYAECKPCGAQFFVRTKAGCERFVARYGASPTKGAPPAAAPKPAPAPKPKPAPAPAPTPTPAGGKRDEKKSDWW